MLIKLSLLIISLVVLANASEGNYRRFGIYDIVPGPYEVSLEKWKNEGKFDLLGQVGQGEQKKWRIIVAPKLQHFVDRMCSMLTVIKCQKLHDDFQQILDEEAQEQKLGRRNLQNGSISFDQYHRHSNINDYLKSLASKYPEFVTLVNIGKSYEGRDMLLIRLSSDGNTKKPAIFVDGGIHAREWISPATVLYIIQQLVENRSETRDLTDKVNWYILPVINVDGYEYTHTDNNRMWRRTRRPVPGTNCIGADPNRNFDYHWMEIGASTKPCEDIFAGTHAFSEVETTNLKKYATKIKKQLKMYLTFHSFGQYLLYPWGYTYDLPNDHKELQTLGESVNNAMTKYKYTVGSVTHALTPGAGGSDDYFKGVLGVNLTYCVELPGETGGFVLPPSKIKGVVTDTFKGVRVFAEYVKNKFT